jgi:hypothetical protein
MGLRMEKDGVVMCPVVLEDRFQLRPDWTMAMLVLLLGRGSPTSRKLYESFS